MHPVGPRRKVRPVKFPGLDRRRRGIIVGWARLDYAYVAHPTTVRLAVQAAATHCGQRIGDDPITRAARSPHMIAKRGAKVAGDQNAGWWCRGDREAVDGTFSRIVHKVSK